MSDCDHNFQFQGVVYHAVNSPLPGSGARSRIYEDAYFCTKCLERVCKNPRPYGNTFWEPIEGSFPK